jgi:solute carrier family 12 (sodium/potassium/chloride transporter), member 2
MANLLAKLRIDFSDLKMLQGVVDKPREETIMLHNKILQGFMENENDECYVSMTEYKQQQAKTYRHLRLREMLMENSLGAKLVVMSLPMPRQVRSIQNPNF